MAFISDGYEETLTSDGQTTAVDTVGPVRISATGSFGGGVLTLQERRQDGSWIAIAAAEFTEAFHKLVDFPPGAQNTLRFSLAGSSGPSLTVVTQGATLR